MFLTFSVTEIVYIKLQKSEKKCITCLHIQDNLGYLTKLCRYYIERKNEGEFMYPISMNKVFKTYSSDLFKYKERSIKCQKDKKRETVKLHWLAYTLDKI